MILLCPWLPDFPLNSCLFLSGSITRVKSRQSSITNDYVSMSTNMKIQIASTIPPLCIKIMRTLLWYVCVLVEHFCFGTLTVVVLSVYVLSSPFPSLGSLWHILLPSPLSPSPLSPPSHSTGEEHCCKVCCYSTPYATIFTLSVTLVGLVGFLSSSVYAIIMVNETGLFANQ